MRNVLRLAIVDPNISSREMLKSMLMGVDMIWLEAEASRYEFFADVVAQTTPDIGMVAIDSDRKAALRLVTQLNERSPDCAVFVASSSNDGDLILKAMRAGAAEFLSLPLGLEHLQSARFAVDVWDTKKRAAILPFNRGSTPCPNSHAAKLQIGTKNCHARDRGPPFRGLRVLRKSPVHLSAFARGHQSTDAVLEQQSNPRPRHPH